MNQALRKSASRGSPKTEKEKVRLSLDISTELNELLESLAAKTGGTKSDVLRKAIALMEVAVEAKRQGKKFGIAEKDQQLSTEIIGL
ncbi:MAG: DNA-binding protein [Pyrinomonadaceae bacterium]|nr:DNA-binding protein [Pyrinomonadaceae bacterium]